MSAEFKPPPEQLAPGLMPDGIVIRHYSLAGDLLWECQTKGTDEAEASAASAAQASLPEMARSGAIVMAFYDGDSGDLIHAALAAQVQLGWEVSLN